MSSQIDPNAFPDNQLIAKGALREQFTIAAEEITELQKIVTPIRKMAFSDAAFDEI